MQDINLELINSLKKKFLTNENLLIKEIIASDNLKTQILVYRNLYPAEILYEEIIQKSKLICGNETNNIKDILLELTILLMSFDESKIEFKTK